MSGGIYLVQGDGQLVEMTEQDYASEDRLQKLLAKYPNLLAGDQIDSNEPRRWLLISREMSLGSEEDGGLWTICSSIRTPYRPSWKSNVALTLISGGR
jgi:hypothetical protein